MPIKKIIRVAGTSHSGSTMLDLMLSNAYNAFSCGEINALFRPYRMHHYDPICGCLNPNCTIWKEVKSEGEKNTWNTLFRLFPKIDIFVDSSKDPVWLIDQKKYDKWHKANVKNVLIWKTPEEYAYSRYKRGLIKNWKKSYINYHLKYFTIADDWISIKYSDLAKNPPRKLKRLCDVLGLEYWPGKEKYWDKEHHTLFGSNSAKSRLNLSFDDNKFRNKTKNNLNNDLISSSLIKYKQIKMEMLPVDIKNEIYNDNLLKELTNILSRNEIDTSIESNSTKSISLTSRPQMGWYYYGKIKRLFRHYSCLLRRNQRVKQSTKQN